MSTQLLLLILFLLCLGGSSERLQKRNGENYEEEVQSGGEEDYSAFFGSKAKKEGQPAEKNGPKVWDRWGKWSSCTVSCGIGKMTRWRHCVAGGCEKGEKEAQIKTCTLSAC